MKKSMIALALVLSPFTSFAAATISCQGVEDADKTVILFVNQQKIVQLRIQTQGSIPKAFAVREVRTNANTSMYSLSGVADLLEVKNSVLNEQGGWLRIGSKRFECDSN